MLPMGIWFLNRGMIAFACCDTLPIRDDWELDRLDVTGRIGVELNIAIASVLAAASVATIALAYRRWCRADLD